MLAAVEEEFEAYQYRLESTDWQNTLPSFQRYASKVVSPTPKVSVIIANFNNAPYLTKMMESLMQQTIGLEHLQIMFIDDRSTDDSLEVIMPYVENYQSIEVYALDQNTGGAHGPRNVGILNARGDYLVFLDADDWYDLDALRYLSQILDASGDDFAVSGIIQSVDGHLTLKSRPYFIDGDFRNRDIQELPAEFYGWLGPQGIMVRHSLIIDHNLHFVNQRVADDVTFFYEAMRFSKKITQGKELTTYLNRGVDNAGLSKTIDRTFMISWLRALSYINTIFPNDTSKERFLSRRIEWLIHDFCLKRDIGYKFSKKRLQDFSTCLKNYLGDLPFDPSLYFRNDFRKTCWKFILEDDISGLYWFIILFCIRWLLNRKLGIKTSKKNVYYYPQLLPPLIKTRLDAFTYIESCTEGELKLKVFTYKKVVRFEMRDIKQPYLSRQHLSYQQFSDNEYRVTLLENYNNTNNQFVVVFEDYSEVVVAKLGKVKLREI